MRFLTSSGEFTAVCCTSTITSPGFRPRSVAWELGVTSTITTPFWSSPIWYFSFRSGVMGAIFRPRPARSTGLAASGLAVVSAVASCESLGFSASVAVTVTSLPSRQRTMGTCLPTSVSATMRGRAGMSFTSCPLKRSTMSPLWIFALSAGPPSFTPAIIAPVTSFSPTLSAISCVTCWMRTPSQPRTGCPTSLSCATMVLTILDGMENPIPTEPPERE